MKRLFNSLTTKALTSFIGAELNNFTNFCLLLAFDQLEKLLSSSTPIAMLDLPMHLVALIS